MYTMAKQSVFQSVRLCQKYVGLKSSCRELPCLSSLRRLITRARSSGERKRASSGKSCTIQYETMLCVSC